MIGAEGKGIGIGERVVISASGQHGGSIVFLHLGRGYLPGGWL